MGKFRGVVVFIMILKFGIFGFSETVLLSKAEIEEAGDIIFVSVNSKDFTNLSVRVSFNTNVLFPFYYKSGKSVSIVPIPIWVTSRNITLEILKKGEVVSTHTLGIRISKKRPRKIVKLNLSSHSKSILTKVGEIMRDREYIAKKISSLNNYCLQSDFPVFSLPSTNRITSKFGVSRRYSDGKVRYHNGIDFSALPDDNVYAVGDGIVIISDDFVANGKSIYIYHGYGIISSYFHLSERFVKEGDFVRRGEIIGKIGDTGIVTAPHLHLGMYVWGVGGYFAVDPLKLISLDLQNQNFITRLVEDQNSGKF